MLVEDRNVCDHMAPPAVGGAGNQVVFCREHDRSTETLDRLEQKLKSYEGSAPGLVDIR